MEQPAAVVENGNKQPELQPPETEVPASSNDIEIVPANEPELSAKEKDLLDTVFALESDKAAVIEDARTKINLLKKEYEECRVENEKLKKKNAQLEQTLIQKEAQSTEPKSKKEQDEILMKAKTLLFEKAKVCKQQEQHIAVLKTQVESVKEVVAITKDMLNLRNTEVEHLQERVNTLDTRIKAEKDRNTLNEKKLLLSQEMYNRLRKEYECQSGIYKELKGNYELKLRILTDELEKFKNPEVTEEVNP